MHLVESYSLASGSKISKPFIYTKFYPLPFDKYICLQTSSKYDAKSYNYWGDCIEIIKPELDKLGITILQIGKDDKPVKGVYSIVGSTNINQLAYVIANSLLMVGVDSVGAHLASGFGKKIVCLYSNNWKNVVRPYWTKPEDCVLLEPDRTNRKPSFSAQENPKTINEIKPEDIAAGVFKLLNIENKYSYQTIYIGNTYFNKLYETVPNQIIDCRTFNLDAIVVRMDYLFDENALQQQLATCPCCVITNKPINIDLLRHFKPNIKEFVYQVDENQSSEFVKKLVETAIPMFLTTELSGKTLNDIKLEYLDLPQINVLRKAGEEEINKLRAQAPLFYQTARWTLSDGKIYPSKWAWLNNKPVDSFETIQEVPDDKTFWNELDTVKILTKKQT